MCKNRFAMRHRAIIICISMLGVVVHPLLAIAINYLQEHKTGFWASSALVAAWPLTFALGLQMGMLGFLSRLTLTGILTWTIMLTTMSFIPYVLFSQLGTMSVLADFGLGKGFVQTSRYIIAIVCLMAPLYSVFLLGPGRIELTRPQSDVGKGVVILGSVYAPFVLSVLLYLYIPWNYYG